MSVCTAARNNACAHYGHRAAVGVPFPVWRPCTRKNADYDALVEQVKAENDPAKAAELTLQADAIVSNDYAVLPLYYKSNNYLMHDNISGFYMTASGNLFFKDVKVG